MLTAQPRTPQCKERPEGRSLSNPESCKPHRQRLPEHAHLGASEFWPQCLGSGFCLSFACLSVFLETETRPDFGNGNRSTWRFLFPYVSCEHRFPLFPPFGLCILLKPGKKQVLVVDDRHRSRLNRQGNLLEQLCTCMALQETYMYVSPEKNGPYVPSYGPTGVPRS